LLFLFLSGTDRKKFLHALVFSTICYHKWREKNGNICLFYFYSSLIFYFILAIINNCQKNLHILWRQRWLLKTQCWPSIRHWII